MEFQLQTEPPRSKPPSEKETSEKNKDSSDEEHYESECQIQDAPAKNEFLESPEHQDPQDKKVEPDSMQKIGGMEAYMKVARNLQGDFESVSK